MVLSRSAATDVLLAHTAGDASSTSRLVPLVYERLRALATRYLERERQAHTLQPTALVHEAYLRLVEIDRVDWRGKTHFFAMAARQMRRILVEHARAAGAAKRGGGAQRITLDDAVAFTPQPSIELISLDRALSKLAELSPRQAEVAELRLFSGLLVKETAFMLGVSERTVKDDWRVARAWLLRELGHGETTGS